MSDTKEQTLAEYIAERNAKSAPDGWTLCDDIEEWGKYYEVYTPQDLDKYLACSELYELTRSYLGYKRSWVVLWGMELEEIQKEIDELIETHKEIMKREAEDREKEKVENYVSKDGLMVDLSVAFDLQKTSN